jgi:hypothetical protein
MTEFESSTETYHDANYPDDTLTITEYRTWISLESYENEDGSRAIIQLSGPEAERLGKQLLAYAEKVRTPEEKILAVLADHDYRDGAGMRWNPSGTPNEQAIKVAKRIVRELGLEEK